MNRKLNLVIKNFIIKTFAVLMIVGMMDSSAFSQTRIRFSPGRSSATVKGKLSGSTERSYILRASEGQTMTVRVSSENASVWVDLGGNDVGKGTTVELRSTDEYIITVHNDGSTTNYTLYVAIR